MFKRFFILLVFILVSSFLRSQEVIEYRGDTLISISPKDLVTINTVFTKYNFVKKELDLYKSLHSVDSVLILTKDSILESTKSVYLEKEDYYMRSIETLENLIEKEKRKHKITKGILVSSAFVILGIILSN